MKSMAARRIASTQPEGHAGALLVGSNPDGRWWLDATDVPGAFFLTPAARRQLVEALGGVLAA